jgi:hypothetical protein
MAGEGHSPRRQGGSANNCYGYHGRSQATNADPAAKLTLNPFTQIW